MTLQEYRKYKTLFTNKVALLGTKLSRSRWSCPNFFPTLSTRNKSSVFIMRQSSLHKRTAVWLRKSLSPFIPRSVSLLKTSYTVVFAFHMVRGRSKKLQIFNSIIFFVSVYVMNLLESSQTSSKVFLHNIPMFSKVSLFATPNSVWHVNKPISFSVNFFHSSSWLSHSIKRMTAMRTKFVFMIFIFPYKRFIAVLTNKIHTYYYSNMPMSWKGLI